MKSTWTEKRLSLLYRRYNNRFWNGKLVSYRIRIEANISGGSALGYCDRRRRLILIDVARLPSDKHVRSTVLHEMTHVAAGAGTGHDSKFFRELERLLHLGAPIMMDTPENENRPFLETIPEEFQLCRRALARNYRQLDRSARNDAEGDQDLDDVVRDQFEEAGLAGFTWQKAYRGLGREYGFLDIDGRVLGWAKPFLKVWRAAYADGLSVRKVTLVVRRGMDA